MNSTPDTSVAPPIPPLKGYRPADFISYLDGDNKKMLRELGGLGVPQTPEAQDLARRLELSIAANRTLQSWTDAIWDRDPTITGPDLVQELDKRIGARRQQVERDPSKVSDHDRKVASCLGEALLKLALIGIPRPEEAGPQTGPATAEQETGYEQLIHAILRYGEQANGVGLYGELGTDKSVVHQIPRGYGLTSLYEGKALVEYEEAIHNGKRESANKNVG